MKRKKSGTKDENIKFLGLACMTPESCAEAQKKGPCDSCWTLINSLAHKTSAEIAELISRCKKIRTQHKK